MNWMTNMCRSKNFDNFDLFISLKRHINKLNQLQLESQVQILQTNEMKINGNI